MSLSDPWCSRQASSSDQSSTYFVKKNSLPEKPPKITFAPLNDSSQYCMVEQAGTYMGTNIDMAINHLFTKKVCSTK